MMRILPGPERFRVATLAELDALVGEMVMDENPSIYWEDADARFRFGSLDEARDVLHDPTLQDFLSVGRCSVPVLKVREFRPYSTAIDAALDIVARLAPEPLQLRMEGQGWAASFGGRAEMRGDSAALAICLAALLSLGREVHLELQSCNGR